MKNKPLNIYDMTQVIEYKGLFYERLSNHPLKEQYRFTKSLASDDYDYVTNKTLIKKLDQLFKGVPNESEV